MTMHNSSLSNCSLQISFYNHCYHVIIVEVVADSMDILQEEVELLWGVGLQDTGTVVHT